MKILALDTTSEHGSVALRAGGHTVAEVGLHSPTGFGHVIFDAIAKCKNKANFDFASIDCFAAASGPGSFTGVRVGLSAVKGLAESTRKPAFGVSNLRALSSFGRNSGKRAVALDARRGQLYTAVYDAHLCLVSPEAVQPFSDWLAQLDAAGEYEFIIPSGSSLPSALAASRLAAMPVIEAPASLAAAVALCAEIDGAAGGWHDPATLDANYVRRSDAELFWTET